MADGIFPTLISRTRDANAANNVFFVQLSDGTNTISVTGSSLDVNITTTDIDIRDLDHSQDNILVYGWDGAANQKIKTDAAGELQIDVLTHAFTNSNALPISKDNAANSELNPIFVHNVDTVVSGEEVHNYDTSTVAADSVDNHDYTVTGTTFFLKSIIIAGSGNIKFEIQTGALASLVTRAVGFLTGRAGDSKQIFFEPAIEVPVTGTGTVRIIRTNRENQTTDVYSTIIGNDV